VKGAMRICTVIGFPNGYNKTKVKVNETAYALSDGADEIDMVINIGDLKNKNYGRITDEIMSVKHECGDKILKVIIETALLTDDEKIMMCNIISDTQADFIKTSTGFAGAGACIQDIALFKKYLSKEVKIKASGGIKTIEDARGFLEAGCSRIGASSLINLI
jgi:deoxyribose-phosphate aldolase